MENEMEYSPTPLLELKPDKAFREMTRKEATVYFLKFVELIPERLIVLEKAVKSSPGTDYKNWKADKTPTSLTLLGQWFAEQVFTIPVSNEFNERYQSKLDAAPDKLKPFMSMPEWVLSDLTFWAIADVGMYLGETLREGHSQLKWELYTKSKRAVNYHKPVLSGFKPNELVCVPLVLTDVLAHQIAERTATESRLLELYNIWSGYVE